MPHPLLLPPVTQRGKQPSTLTTPSSIAISQHSAAILNAILDLRSRGSRENSSKICVTFLYSLPTEYYSHRFTFTAVTSRAFCCLDRLRAINLSTFVSSSNSNSVAVSQTSKLTPRTLAPSQANANRAECVNSALKEGYPLPVAGGGEKKQNKTLDAPDFRATISSSVCLSVCLSACSGASLHLLRRHRVKIFA